MIALTLLMALAVESGPKAGEKVGELKAFVVVGPVQGKELDVTADRGEKPTAYLLVNADKFDRPMARFLKTLDTKLADVADAGAVAVWVGGDADMLKTRLPLIQTSLQFDKTPLAVFTGDKAGPAGWAVNADAHLTVVVAKGGKVVKSVALVSVTDKDVPAVVEALKK